MTDVKTRDGVLSTTTVFSGTYIAIRDIDRSHQKRITSLQEGNRAIRGLSQHFQTDRYRRRVAIIAAIAHY